MVSGSSIATSSSFFVSSATLFSSGLAAFCSPSMASITAERALPGSMVDASASSLSALDVFSGSLNCTMPRVLNTEDLAASSHPSHSSLASTATDAVFSPASAAAHVVSATASLHHPPIVGVRNTRVDQGAHLHFLQRRVLQGQLPLRQAFKKRPESAEWRLGHVAAVFAAVILACSVVGTAAQHVVVSDSSGTWSTAALSQARWNLAATSLPDAGVAIFAGGYSTSCDFCLRCWRMGARGMREL